MSSIKLTPNASGTGIFTVAAPNSNTDRTLTLPDSTGTFLTTGTAGVPVNGPAFSAYRASNQSISAATYTKIQFGSEDFDTASCYDSSTNYRFTPNVAGYYQISSTISISAYSNRYTAYLYKNGSSFLIGLSNTGNGTNTDSVGVYGTIYLNGSTDYVEIYVQGNNAVTVEGSSGRETYFQAFLARSAT
jgi:hypothetical protein